MYFRFIIVNTFSLIKRVLSFNPYIYNIIVFIPFLTVLTRKISRKSIVFVIIFTIIIIITGNLSLYRYLLPYLALLLAVPMFRSINFERFLSKFSIFYLAVSIYGILQNIFGYAGFELSWLKSGLSTVSESALLNSPDIRPFSTFASIPEFTFFISIFLYLYSIKHQYFLVIFSFLMLYIAGSRGIIISVLIAYFFTFVVKKYNYKFLIYSFISAIGMYVFLLYIYPILSFSFDNNSRIFVYGTFFSRVLLLKSIIENSSITTILFGMDISTLPNGITFDNIYLMLITSFGIGGTLYFLWFLTNTEINKKSFFFLSIFLGYGLYADMVFSYYLMFLFFLSIFSTSKEMYYRTIGKNNKRFVFITRNKKISFKL